MKNTINTTSFSDRFGKHLHEKGISNDDMFKCLNHLKILLDNILFSVLDINTISTYSI